MYCPLNFLDPKTEDNSASGRDDAKRNCHAGSIGNYSTNRVSALFPNTWGNKKAHMW